MAATVKPRAVHYPERDGKPMAETDVHRRAMNDLILRLEWRYAPVRRTYASGNLLVYWEQGNTRRSLAPDCFVAFDVRKTGDRRTFKTWEEGAFPAVVFEITSKSTKTEDLEKKWEIYRTEWKIREYFLFDPLEEYLDPSLRGYRLVGGEFEALPASISGLLSAALGVRIQRDGNFLKLTDAATGLPVINESEAKSAAAEARAAESKIAAVEAKADAALAELAALKAELARRGGA